ncbi:MAG: GNAT family N-acetyltransferase [Gammaproteobacteria bacterium]
MQLTLLDSLNTLPAAQWNSLAGDENPFLRHEFLAALERHHCVGAEAGWWPQHLIVEDNGQLLGAVPMYLKNNSYGEFVFDWAWAEAYQRSGLHYYPKLVVSIPYTPATGSRLLLADTPNREAVADLLIEGALNHARNLNLSSMHWLFTDDADTQRLERHGLMRRVGCQYHWTNQGYRDFDDFLSDFSAEKRKKVKRERRQVRESGVALELLNGHQISDEQWDIFHAFYASTFDEKGGIASLTPEFFKELGRTMPDQTLLIMARHDGRHVAGAFFLRGRDTLYGRHWGCTEHFHSLHFEACYYRAIDYCIEHGIKRFEAGAQGEHKISRGFLPTPTYSAHWIAHEGFRNAIEDFLTREKIVMGRYMQELAEHSPYKCGVSLD